MTSEAKRVGSPWAERESFLETEEFKPLLKQWEKTWVHPEIGGNFYQSQTQLKGSSETDNKMGRSMHQPILLMSGTGASSD